MAGNSGQDPCQYDDDVGDHSYDVDVNVADDCDDSYDDDDDHDDDGVDELTIHSIMSVRECLRRANRLAKLASKLDSNIGQHRWPAPVASTINTLCQHSAAPVVSTTGRHHWPGPLATCSKRVDEDDNADEHHGDGDDELTIYSITCGHECARRAIACQVGQQTGLHEWPTILVCCPAPLASSTGQQCLPARLASNSDQHHWLAKRASSISQQYLAIIYIQEFGQEAHAKYRIWGSNMKREMGDVSGHPLWVPKHVPKFGSSFGTQNLASRN